MGDINFIKSNVKKPYETIFTFQRLQQKNVDSQRRNLTFTYNDQNQTHKAFWFTSSLAALSIIMLHVLNTRFHTKFQLISKTTNNLNCNFFTSTNKLTLRKIDNHLERFITEYDKKIDRINADFSPRSPHDTNKVKIINILISYIQDFLKGKKVKDLN